MSKRKNAKTHAVTQERTDRKILFSITTDSGLVVETFRSGGKGGQNVNKVETGARVRHPESGATGESTTERTQWLNKRLALQRMVKTPQFQYWLRLKIRDMERGYSAEEWVEREMANLSHFKVEYKDDHGRWVEA